MTAAESRGFMERLLYPARFSHNCVTTTSSVPECLERLASIPGAHNGPDSNPTFKPVYRRASCRTLGAAYLDRPQLPECEAIAFATCSLTDSMLKEAPFCIGGNSMKLCAARITTSCTKTKRQNSYLNQS